MTKDELLGPRSKRGLLVPLTLSVLAHSLVVLFAWITIPPVPPPTQEPLQVELREPEPAKPAKPAPQAKQPAPEQVEPPRPKTQMVTPPDSPEAKPDKPRFLSDRDSRTDEETVKRGEENAPPAEKKPKDPERTEQAEMSGKKGERSPEPQPEVDVAKPKQPAPELTKRKLPEAEPLPGLDDLFAKPSEMIKDPKLGGTEGSGETGEDKQKRDLARATRPDIFTNPGERGVLDYLPDIRQGKFTLLNTKADMFAPFVRRVGLRVFQSFSSRFKRDLYEQTVPAGKERLEVEAIMSKDGRRIEVHMRGRDGNLSTDKLLFENLNENVFFDENPPRGAVAADGRIHFIFELDAMVGYQRSDNGGMSPYAQWVFGAGLL